MKKYLSVTAAAALAIGASTLLAPAPAQAAKPLKGSVSGAVTFDCAFGDSPFTYDAKIKLSGVRKTKTTKAIALTAKMSDLPGIAPIALDYDVEDKLYLTVGTTKTTLKGKGHVNVPANTPVPVPPLKGSAANRKNALPVTVTKFEFIVLGSTITCTPAEGQGALGTLKLR